MIAAVWSGPKSVIAQRDHGLTIDGIGGSDKIASLLKAGGITARMRWFRDTIRESTWLALIALAINLGLSFGHFHATDGKASGSGIVAVAASTASPDGQKQGDSHADYLCPICMAASAMANALASTAPALPPKFTNVTIDRPIEPVLALVEPLRAAFQPRGPPIS